MAEICVCPNYDDQNQKASSYYFYSTYNPAEHFEYKLVFEKDGETIDEKETNKNKAKAYAKAIEYHFLQEQVLPVYQDNKQYFNFYIPKLNNEGLPLDYNYDFSSVTEAQLPVNDLFNELYIKTDTLHNILILRNYQYYAYVQDPQGTYMFDEEIGWYRLINSEDNLELILNRYIKDTNQRLTADEDITSMNIYKLIDVYNCIQDISTDNYKDATNINKHAYNTATYVHITRPQGEDGYHFVRCIKNVNQVFQFKLPTDIGWYKYNKITKKWEYIELKEATSNG